MTLTLNDRVSVRGFTGRYGTVVDIDKPNNRVLVQLDWNSSQRWFPVYNLTNINAIDEPVFEPDFIRYNTLDSIQTAIREWLALHVEPK